MGYVTSLCVGLLCLFARGSKSQESELSEILSLIQALTDQYTSERTEVFSKLEEMKTELIQDVREMIDGNKVQATSVRHDLANLQQLLETDECAQMSHNCSADAICIDTRVSFRCKCKPGLTGDGYSCTDTDECAANETICGPNSVCQNTLGSHTCECDEGYAMKESSGTCEDIDECREGKNNCSTYAICENLPGGYNCTCSIHHEGDGFSCKGIEMNCTEPFKAVRGIGCIHITEESEEFDQGRESCKALGGDLFVADNKDHYLRLAQHFRSTDQVSDVKYMWVGVKEGVWLSGREVDPAEEAPENPSMTSEKCSYTDGDPGEDFLLWTDPCYYEWRSLCQQEI
ncbi:signal peptide, CUB and EGF-like domain-containing protein 2 [Macrobrachium nipponense]|uniref:signal peptide, CUB and EGF-like domain-containing protein 2 n=1 Tax=Macrobrachium nipponense TaxID=159736 RepID=UPI0030C7DF5D